MEDTDASQDALRQVQEITESGPGDGEELLESPELQRQWREAKQKLDDEEKAKSAKP